ncbi:MAG: HPP family protein [Steroidobacteraceae bacterium]
MTGLRSWFAALRPAALTAPPKERLRAAAGGLVGIAIAGFAAHVLSLPFHFDPWLIAPIGASAVLVFAVPASPLAQPWAVIGGNTVSALVGITCALFIPGLPIAAAVAVGAAILAMFVLRCLHPPGGATALLAVLSAWPAYRYALLPVALDSLLLVFAGMVFNALTGRSYPHAQFLPPQPAGSRFSAADLDTALAHYQQVIDVSREDLAGLLNQAEAAAYRRTLGELRCRDVMSSELVTADYAMPLGEAWTLMRERRIKALPVVDRAQRLVGIVTLADFMRHAEADGVDGLGTRLRSLLRGSGLSHSDRPEVVGQIMARRVRIGRADWHVIELVPMFSEGGHHHLPILDGGDRLVGIVTESDLMRALYATVRLNA